MPDYIKEPKDERYSGSKNGKIKWCLNTVI